MGFDEQPDPLSDCMERYDVLKRKHDALEASLAAIKGTMGSDRSVVDLFVAAEERAQTAEARLMEVTSTIKAVPFSERQFPTREDMRVEIHRLQVERRKDEESHKNALHSEISRFTELSKSFDIISADNADYKSTFDLQHRRLKEVTRLWRLEKPGRDLILPDLGVILKWLGDRAEAAESRARDAGTSARSPLDVVLGRVAAKALDWTPPAHDDHDERYCARCDAWEDGVVAFAGDITKAVAEIAAGRTPGEWL